MLTLYIDPNSPFCQRILQMADNLDIRFELKDITEDEEARAELKERKGDEQTPYLIDENRSVPLDDTNDIIEYIREHYAHSGAGATGAAKPRVHVGGSVCESCEG